MGKVIRFPTERSRPTSFSSMVLEVPVTFSTPARNRITSTLKEMFGTDQMHCVCDEEEAWTEDDPVGYVMVDGEMFPILDFTLDLSAV